MGVNQEKSGPSQKRYTRSSTMVVVVVVEVNKRVSEFRFCFTNYNYQIVISFSIQRTTMVVTTNNINNQSKYIFVSLYILEPTVLVGFIDRCCHLIRPVKPELF